MAIELAGAVVKSVAAEHSPGRGQRFAGGTDIDVLLFVIVEVGADKATFRCDLSLILNRYVGRNIVFDQPTEHLTRAIGDVAGDTIRFKAKSILRPIDHGLGGIDLLGDPCRRRLDIEDDSVLHVDQIVEAIDPPPMNWSTPYD